MIINMSGAGAPGKVVTVHVPPEAGATVTCTDGKKTVSAVTDSSCNAVFKLSKGAWSVTAQKSGVSKTANVNVTDNCSLELSLNQIPAFTYTGEYAIVDDRYNPISSTLGNWKLFFLTSGVLTFTELNGAEAGIDVFLVGGGGGGGAYNEGLSNSQQVMTGYGGGGGGGGYTSVATAVKLEAGISYSIIVGAGGSPGGNGGETSAFGTTAAGGSAGGDGAMYTIGAGGDGGSNGGNGGASTTASSGESDGSPGQGSTTREFAEAAGTLFSGGGGGGGSRGGDSTSTTWGTAGTGGNGGGGDGGSNSNGNAKSGETNTGGGGGGGGGNGANAGSGGSGIVIIRNHREVT